MNVKSVSRDPLTGLMDRSVMEGVEHEFSSRLQQWSIVILDVDHFKLVNDVYGHLTGDDILSHVGHTISVNLRRRDKAIRYGGDEFLVILPDTDGNSALDLAQRLLFELESREFPEGLRISASLGIAQSKPEDRDLKKMISMADQALYRAKETGRGRFFLADNLSLHREVEPDFTHMVGRREELQQLREMLDSITVEKSQLCLVTGCQGMGKTRLISELDNYCSFKKIPVLRTEMHPAPEEHGFLAVSSTRKALESLSEKEISLLVQKTAPIDPVTAEHLGEYGFRIKTRSTPSCSSESWIRSRKDFSRILLEASSVRPLVIVLDNLQYGSDNCIRYMAEVLVEIPDAEILTIAVARNPQSVSPLRSVFEESRRLVLHLKPMSRADVRTMLFFALKTPGLPADILDYMMRQSGGNTLFLRKLIRWCIDTGSLSVSESDICRWTEPGEEELPKDIISVIEDMLGACSEEELRILKRAALAGDSLNLSLLERLTGMGELTLSEFLDGFAKKELIHERANALSFSYGVVRSYLISIISTSLRNILHEKTAGILEEISCDSPNLNTAGIAAHYCRSSNEAKALEYSGKAAKQTFAQGFNTQSINWYGEYLKRLTKSSDPVEFFRANLNIGILFSITGKSIEAEKHLTCALELAESPEEMCAVHYRLGDNHKRRSSGAEAIAHYRKAVSIGGASGTVNKTLLNNMIGALLESSHISSLQNRFEESSKILSDAKKLMDGSPGGYDPVLDGLYYARLADLESDAGSPAKAMEYYRTGLDIATRNEDLNGEALIMNNMHDLFVRSGDYDSMLETLKQVVKLNTRLDDQLGLAIAYYNLAEFYSILNMMDLARRYFQLYMELNSKIGNRLGIGYGQLGLGRLFALEGKSEDALQHFLNASDVFEKLGCTEMMCEAQLEKAKVDVEKMEYSRALKTLDFVEPVSSSKDFINLATHLRGYLLVLTGESVDRGIFMIESSLRNAENLTPFDTVFMYGNLYRAYSLSGSEEQALHSLSNGIEVLETTLKRIKTESIRNSILSRADVSNYLSLCREMGVACSL